MKVNSVDGVTFGDSARAIQEALAEVEGGGGQEALQRVIRASEAAREAAERALVAAQTPAPDTKGAFASATHLDLVRLAQARHLIRTTPPALLSGYAARVPTALDRHTERFVARYNALLPDRREHITKQDVAAEALALFFAVYPLPPEEAL